LAKKNPASIEWKRRGIVAGIWGTAGDPSTQDVFRDVAGRGNRLCEGPSLFSAGPIACRDWRDESKLRAKRSGNLFSIHNRLRGLWLNLNDLLHRGTVDCAFDKFLQRWLEKFQSAHRLADDSSSEQSRRKL